MINHINIDHLNIERNKEQLFEFEKERQRKKNIYNTCATICSYLINILENISNPIDKLKIQLYIKKIKIFQKKYYVPSYAELYLQRKSK